MTGASLPTVTWDERVTERSPAVQRSRTRTIKQARLILDAARRLIAEKGDAFTTQELAKEAGVAVQTFYSYFGSKDELFLAVIGDFHAEYSAAWAEAAKALPDPVSRLRFYITSSLETLDGEGEAFASAQFNVSTHWRLHRKFPTEIDNAQKPFVDLLRAEVRAGVEAGLLDPSNPDLDPWFIVELVRTVYHHYAFAPERTPKVKEDLWQFCLKALGGSPGRLT